MLIQFYDYDQLKVFGAFHLIFGILASYISHKRDSGPLTFVGNLLSQYHRNVSNGHFHLLYNAFLLTFGLQRDYSPYSTENVCLT